MKILLVNPPFFRFIGLEQDYPPLSLLAVGAQLKKEGHTVFIKNLEVDRNLSYKGYKDRSEGYENYLKATLLKNNHEVWDELRQEIQLIKPDRIGITVLNVKYKSALKIIEIAKEFNIECFVGGMHPSTYPDSYPKSVVTVEGEFENCGSSEILDLDFLPYTDYSMLLDNYGSEGYGHIVTSRGCPFSCRFCSSSVLWRQVRYKSAKRIIKEMRYIEKNFNPDCFTIWDETFVITKKRLSDFCKNYDLSTSWRCDTRADTLDNERIKMMKDANCIQVSMGIESGSNEVLKYINKGETIEDYKKASEVLNKNGVQWKAYCIIGFPIETKEDMLETIRFTKSLKPTRITLSFFTPYKGTSLYNECESLGLIKDDADLSMYSHQSPHNYFCPLVPKSEFFKLKDYVSKEMDEYNKEALKTWRK